MYLAAGIVVFSCCARRALRHAAEKEGPVVAADTCGDLSDPDNIRHLSHHPQQYGDCITRIDPQRFRNATGQVLDDYISKNGIR